MLVEAFRAILESARRADDGDEPRESLRRLLDECVRQTHADGGCLYVLRLSESAYVCTCQTHAGDIPPPIKVNFLEPESSESSDPIRKAIRTRQPLVIAHSSHSPASSRVIVPIVRGRTCMGVFELTSGSPDHFDSYRMELVAFAAGTALYVLEKEDSLILLSSLPQPVDYNHSFQDFLSELMQLCGSASGMPFIALREWQHDKLVCIASKGFPDADLEDLNLDPITDFPEFHSVILTKHSKVERSIWEPHLSRMRTIKSLAKVRSFVIAPVTVGTDVYGTLSFAAACEYDYSELDVRGFETIANAAGVAIANFRNVRAAREALVKEIQDSAAITSLEVAQSVRHECLNYVHEANELLTILITESKNNKHLDVKLGHEVGEKIKEMGLALDKIKEVTKIPERVLSAVSLRTVWQDEFNLLIGRLERAAIKYNIDGDAACNAYVDSLRTAFLNLILNSIDAFAERRQKQDRTIKVTIEPNPGRAADVVVIYRDNATGIDPSRLRPWPQEGAVRSVQDIFKPGITSKQQKQGSGYGMYLVRKIINDHGGDIRLIEWRRGVVFQITLPKELVRATGDGT